MKIITLEQLHFCDHVRPGDRVTWGQCAAEPTALTGALMTQRHEIGGIWKAFLGTTWCDATLNRQYADVVEFQAWGAAGQNRKLAQFGLLDILPSHYSELEFALGPTGPNRVDVLLLQVAPRGPDGRFSLSAAHEYLVPLVSSARIVIAQVNEFAPWTYGARPLEDGDIDVLIHHTNPLPYITATTSSDTDRAIAHHISGLIDDGDTLQMGIGSIPDAVLRQLVNHRDLGIHSGTISDAYVDLVELGVITNSRKTLNCGLTVTGVLMGGPRLMAHAHLNRNILMHETAYTHGIQVLAQQHHLVAINSAVEVDLTGQVNAEAAGDRYVGAVGGALDFLRGARLSCGGKAVIGLPSRTGAKSRIVASLSGPVSTPRSDICFVVTEFGVADLRGATIKQRIERMLAIAHPQDQADLEKQISSHSTCDRVQY